MMSNRNLFIYSTSYIELNIYFIFIYTFISLIILCVLNFILDTVIIFFRMIDYQINFKYSFGK